MAISNQAMDEMLDRWSEVSRKERGLILTIEVKAYDNGHVYINGWPMDNRLGEAAAWTGANVTISQLLHRLQRRVLKRQEEQQAA